MVDYLSEPVDALPFGSEEKARRYATERYVGATGRNWYTCDPTLQFLMRRYLGQTTWRGRRPTSSGSAR